MKSLRRTTLSDLWVSTHDRTSDFYTSSWQPGESAVPMLVVRFLLAGVAVSILVWSLVEACGAYWLVFLTNWGLLLVTLMTVSGLLMTMAAFCGKMPDTGGSEGLPWYVSMYWLFHNVAVSTSFMITALYWTLLYEGESGNLFGLDIATHGINSCIAFVEVVSSRTPVRFLHIYQPIGVSIWYTVFSCIYYGAGGTDGDGNPFIYAVLDWREPKQSGLIAGIAVLAHIVMYILLWVFALGRDKLSSSLVKTYGHDLPNMTTNIPNV